MLRRKSSNPNLPHGFPAYSATESDPPMIVPTAIMPFHKDQNKFQRFLCWVVDWPVWFWNWKDYWNKWRRN